MKITKIIAAAAVASLATGIVAATASAYTGAISFQSTGTYTFRDPIDAEPYGSSSDYWADNIIMWGNNSDATWPDLADEHYDYDIKGYVFDADYTDATITADGTYKIAAEGFDWTRDGAGAFNFVQISTDIPADSGAVISDAKIIVDGVEQSVIAAPCVEDSGLLRVSVLNIWNTDVPSYSGAYPTKSLAIEFKVSGLGAGAVDPNAPTAGGDKASPDTGVEGVAAVAGLAVVAGGALLLSKKRK